MKDEITQLHEEIERLNYFITLLIEKNRQLQAQIIASHFIEKDGLVSQGAGIKNEMAPESPDLADDKSENRYKYFSLANANIENAIKGSSDGIRKNDIGDKSSNIADHLNDIGVKDSFYADADNKIGYINSNSANDKKNIGINYPGIADADTGKAVKHPDFYVATGNLRSIMPTCSFSSVDNAAKILIQLFTKPRNSYKELKALTGLSQDGLTKHIRMLKRRRLIVRTAFQQYTLTATALKVLEVTGK